MAGARLGAAGLFLIWGGVAVFGEPPLILQCPLLDERGTPAPRPALLRILGGPETPPAPGDPELTFDVTDPRGVLRGFWGPSGEPPRCELSPTEPLLPPPGTEGTPPQCPQGLGTRCWLLALGTPRREGTALLQGGDGTPARVTATLVLSTLSPHIRGVLGTPQTLQCSLSVPGGDFTLEWLRHRGGHAHSLLAFRGDTNSVTRASPGVLLLLGGQGQRRGTDGDQGTQPLGGALEVSLQLARLSMADDGAFVCSVTTPYGQVQQVLRMNVIAPPQVSLVPPLLSPGVPSELRCDAVGFFPLDVGIRWERRARGDPRPLAVTSGDTPGDTSALTWSSGHRRAADGTFSRSAGLRVALGTPGDSYSCVVTHPAWDTPHRVTVQVADPSSPSVEDVAGVALVAFVIGGLCLRLWPPAGR